MKDAIGQEINVGDKVCHCGGHYADAKILEVIKITAKQVTVDDGDRHKRNASLHPDTLINVTSNLAKLAEDVEEMVAEEAWQQGVPTLGPQATPESIAFMRGKEPQVIHLWAEGYHVQGNQSKANYLGEYEALTKSDAFNRWADEQDQYTQETYVDRDRETYYGCRTYDNEIDARKSFG